MDTAASMYDIFIAPVLAFLQGAATNLIDKVVAAFVWIESNPVPSVVVPLVLSLALAGVNHLENRRFRQ